MTEAHTPALNYNKCYSHTNNEFLSYQTDYLEWDRNNNIR